MARKKLQRSKIDLLPSDIREQLNLWIRSGSMTQQDALAALRELIDEAGLPEDAKPSYTALNRYTRRMDEMGARVREAREVAEVWAHKLGDAPVSEVGKLLQEFVRTMAFETSAHMMESDDPIPPKALGQLALVVQRVEQAAMTSHKVEKEIRKAFAEEMAEKTDQVAKKAGLTSETVKMLKAELLGIA
ncbi:DUF3486 family protein [Vibrio harveyi]|uniref:DUF3486 family protein n=1 Tax=Vibrio harveyi TaxID=669 RepID=UPI000682100C|nr:DUF3486 family protein [Vibrio harveyi]